MRLFERYKCVFPGPKKAPLRREKLRKRSYFYFYAEGFARKGEKKTCFLKVNFKHEPADAQAVPFRKAEPLRGRDLTAAGSR